MTERDETTPDQPAGPTDEEHPVDVYLDILLDALLSEDQPGGHFSLTVICGGSVLSGIAISRSAWESAWLDQLEQGGMTGVDEMRDTLGELGRTWLAQRQRLRDAGQLVPALRFLHMRDVAVYPAGIGGPVLLPLWRGRLEQVDGWSMGAFSRRAEG